MNIVNIIIFFLALRYKKSRRGETTPVKWLSILNIIIFSSLALIAAHSIPGIGFDTLIDVASLIPAAALSYLVLSQPEFKGRKMMLFAWLPLVVVQFITEFASSPVSEIYQGADKYFEIAGISAFIWAIAMSINNSRQAKKLESERLEALERKRELEIAAKRKIELETLVRDRTSELVHQNDQLETALDNLRSTQAQLIHAEKMASLGELTAGIAHEIQNPLNFVSNFSEVSNELMEEMQEELRKGDLEEAIVLSNDIRGNLEKIIHHGKRADAIVKGMLAHSRMGKGEREPTDINALAEDYLKLSYHGLRAKDKSFNADFKTDLDPELPKVNVVPQDIGRVLLNLINNAFQAVNERSKMGEPGYKPEVSVKTEQKTKNQILITISDNGPGIPDDIKNKIFQPFFTTKPTGQGTGLGLSLSYDIVKAHGGQLNLKTNNHEETVFTILLPT